MRNTRSAAWPAVVIAASTLLAGCASTTTYQPLTSKTYRVGGSVSAPVGGPLIASQSGRIETTKRWVGVLNSPDGWKSESKQSDDYVKKELVYSGVTGNTIDLLYREYRSGMAAPAFFQNVKYDLTSSKIITFQNLQIEVLSATNSGITARVLAD